MDSIKGEELVPLQLASAGGLAAMLRLCEARTPCPNPKVLKNLTGYWQLYFSSTLFFL
jgi:hypothetical protein